jgi:hypothetical protein
MVSNPVIACASLLCYNCEGCQFITFSLTICGALVVMTMGNVRIYWVVYIYVCVMPFKSHVFIYIPSEKHIAIQPTIILNIFSLTQRRPKTKLIMIITQNTVIVK